jgi:hypothetical protein
MAKKEALGVALDALERLLKMFRAERYVYLVLTGVSFILMIYVAYLLATTKTADTATLVAIFGSSGLIAASSVRVSWFFNKAFTLVEKLIGRLSD